MATVYEDNTGSSRITALDRAIEVYIASVQTNKDMTYHNILTLAKEFNAYITREGN